MPEWLIDSKGEVLGRWLTVFMGLLLNIYLISKIKKDNHRVKLFGEELEKGIISFVRFGFLIAKDFYSMILKVSKENRIVLMIGGT